MGVPDRVAQVCPESSARPELDLVEKLSPFIDRRGFENRKREKARWIFW
jgi:hypothetical protein